MNRKTLNWWLSVIANLGVIGGLIFVGYEVRQNTVQLRAESSHSITESVNALRERLRAAGFLMEFSDSEDWNRVSWSRAGASLC